MLSLFQAIRSYLKRRKEKKQKAAYDAYRERQRWEQAAYKAKMMCEAARGRKPVLGPRQK